jgi:hypothetical protein
MKKLLTILMAIAMAFSLTACEDDNTSGSVKSDSPSSQIDSSGDNSDNKPADDNQDGVTPVSGYNLQINDVAVMNVMDLAVVNYDCKLTARHEGKNMFGEYTGELAMEYNADLSGLKDMMQMAGISMDYKTDGWFKNTEFKMELTEYTAEAETKFTDSLKDPNMTDEQRALSQSLIGDIGSGDKEFETANSPSGLWYDWAFHMTEGDMSAYVNMTSDMFNASASQDSKAQTAEGYAEHILAGSFHESLSYENESPFPYQIEAYESGDAVLTLRNPNESPVVVKFYGTIIPY